VFGAEELGELEFEEGVGHNRLSNGDRLSLLTDGVAKADGVDWIWLES
jgi:hypothetical protein